MTACWTGWAIFAAPFQLLMDATEYLTMEQVLFVCVCVGARLPPSSLAPHSSFLAFHSSTPIFPCPPFVFPQSGQIPNLEIYRTHDVPRLHPLFLPCVWLPSARTFSPTGLLRCLVWFALFISGFYALWCGKLVSKSLALVPRRRLRRAFHKCCLAARLADGEVSRWLVESVIFKYISADVKLARYMESAQGILLSRSTLSGVCAGLLEIVNTCVVLPTQKTGAGVLPQLTVCNSSPVRCACEAFYDDRLIEEHLEKVHAAFVNNNTDTFALDMSPEE